MYALGHAVSSNPYNIIFPTVPLVRPRPYVLNVLRISISLLAAHLHNAISINDANQL